MKWGRVSLVIFGALLITALGIDAADTLNGSTGTLLSKVIREDAGVCPKGMVPVLNVESLTCVDVYEASPSDDCVIRNPASALESQKNINTDNCFAASVAGREPWNYISLPQAQLMCSRAGKRLPTNEEWYQIALGTNSEGCVLKENKAQITGTPSCVSSIGLHDAIGNVWEWVDEEVNGNTFNSRALPSEGYVTSVDREGIAVTSGGDPDELYDKDYFWSKQEGVFGMIRGGFYGSGDDAGLYTTNASVQTSFASPGVGFRCVQGEG